MRAVFVDASETLAAVARRLLRPDDPPFAIHADPGIAPEDLPGILAGAEIAVIDHTALPVDVARACAGLKHVVFLGTGARSYMDPEALPAALGVTVHTIKGYGDTAVAECAFALMWAAARGLPEMDRAMRAGSWLRTEAIQLTGKTVGLVGFGGIAAEMARLCRGIGMRVLAWNRTPKTHPGVDFVPAGRLLAGERRGLAPPAPDRRDPRLPVGRAHRRDEARRDPDQHRPGRGDRRGCPGRGPAHRPDRAGRARRVHGRAPAGGSPAGVACPTSPSRRIRRSARPRPATT